MFVGVLLSHLLDAVGVLYIVITTAKIASGYPITRWFL